MWLPWPQRKATTRERAQLHVWAWLKCLLMPGGPAESCCRTAPYCRGLRRDETFDNIVKMEVAFPRGGPRVSAECRDLITRLLVKVGQIRPLAWECVRRWVPPGDGVHAQLGEEGQGSQVAACGC
jgi:hypothetical protein